MNNELNNNNYSQYNQYGSYDNTYYNNYNGLIDVESEVGKTKFTIEIPIEEE